MDERTMRNMRDGVKKVPTPILAAAIVILVFLFAKPWVQVGPGQRGVVLYFGAVQESVLAEGLHFRIPIMQEVVLMDVKVQKVVTDTVAASADLQDVTSSIALNYHLVPDKANIVYQTIGVYYKERIIDPAILEVVKAVSATYTAEALITKRPQVSEAMRVSLMERLKEYNIAVDAFSIVAFSFSKVFAEAIEAKQTAEQLALKARRDLERVKIEAEQKVTAARAEAESLRLQRANISPDLIELRRIEANLKAIEKWDGIMPQVVGTGGVPLIGLGDVKKR
ncbi:MAG TPA: prohibitin family protein [Deltaproteobacteria bacterium]|nr:prohibitin family protein [Deltaproteobacteria bacterium]